jgi:hypothetical protein
MNGAILAKQFALNYLTLDRNLSGISNELSLVGPTRGGNCINWVVGHILSTRNAGHQLLGIPPAWEDPVADRYKRGSKPMIDAAEAVRLETLVALCRTSQGALNDALLTTTDDDLEREVDDKPLGLQLAELSFHESYHAGQLGVLRRVVGLAGVIR